MEPTFVPEVARRFAMGFLMLVHLQFAAFLIGTFALAVTFEFFGLLNPTHPHLDRFAHSLGKTAAIIYSTGAVLAFSFMLLTSIFWPIFWSTLFRVNFWPFFLEAITFALTVLYLFPWYFTWERLARFKWVHLSMGAALVVAAQFQQSMIDVVASFMLTPAQSTDFLRIFFNPTAVPLDLHRLVGDLSWAGFAIAGYAAFKTLRARTPEQRAYYDWMGSVGVIAGVGFMFLQAAIGVEYMEEIRANSPGGFNTMMRGRNAWLFLLQVTFLSVLFLLGMIYMTLQVRKSRRPRGRLMWWLVGAEAVGALLLMQPYTIGPNEYFHWVNWVNPIGSMQPWKYIAMAIMTLASISAVLVYVGAQRKGMRWGFLGSGGRGAQYSLLTLAVFASFMMALMGYIRENSRIPYLIFYQQTLDQPEQYPGPGPTPTPSPGTSSLGPRLPQGTIGGADGTAATASETGGNLR